MQSSNCELIKYKVPKLSYTVDVKDRERVKRKAKFENTIRISVSDKDTSKGSVIIETNMEDDAGEIQYAIEIRGIFKFIQKGIEEDEKEKILKDEGFKILYLKMDEIIKSISEITKQKLPNIPEFSEIEPLE